MFFLGPFNCAAYTGNAGSNLAHVVSASHCLPSSLLLPVISHLTTKKILLIIVATDLFFHVVTYIWEKFGTLDLASICRLLIKWKQIWTQAWNFRVSLSDILIKNKNKINNMHLENRWSLMPTLNENRHYKANKCCFMDVHQRYALWISGMWFVYCCCQKALWSDWRVNIQMTGMVTD